MRVFEVITVTTVKGIPLQIKTVEAADTPDLALKAHALEIACAHPKHCGAHGLVLSITPRPDLGTWAREQSAEAIARAKYDSRKASLPISEETKPVVHTCLACFFREVYGSEKGETHTCDENYRHAV